MKTIPKLSPKKKYLQVALNGTLDDAFRIIQQLPQSDRILVEAGTPLIKRYGEDGIRSIYNWYSQRLSGSLLTGPVAKPTQGSGFMLLDAFREMARAFAAQAPKKAQPALLPFSSVKPYIVADLKMMDRGETEVELAARAGASAAVALGIAPIESLNAFIEQCDRLGLDAMIDMMNVEYPLAVINKLRKLPAVIVLHRGVDEERFNKEKQIPLHEIRRIKSQHDLMIAVAGGDTIREVQRSIFNDADIVVAWKSFYQSTKDTASLAQQFLDQVK